VTAYRVLVTGSRDWDDQEAVSDALFNVVADAPHRPVVVVHGACPSGADKIADGWVPHAVSLGADYVTVERHPADWAGHGTAAGPRRNAEMVAAGADVCLAFIRGGSAGASHCARLAERAGVPVRRWTA
jgi:hypothetical protein